MKCPSCGSETNRVTVILGVARCFSCAGIPNNEYPSINPLARERTNHMRDRATGKMLPPGVKNGN